MEFTNMGSLVAYARDKMSQPELSRATGIPRSNIAHIETARMWARPKHIKAIEEATGCKITVKFFCERPEKPLTSHETSLQ